MVDVSAYGLVRNVICELHYLHRWIDAILIVQWPYVHSLVTYCATQKKNCTPSTKFYEFVFSKTVGEIALMSIMWNILNQHGTDIFIINLIQESNTSMHRWEPLQMLSYIQLE